MNLPAVSKDSLTFFLKYYGEQNIEPGALDQGQKSSYQPPNFTYVDNRWDWSTRHTTVIHPGTKSQEEKDDESAKKAAIIGSIAMCISAFTVGYFYQRHSKSSESLNECDRHFKALEDYGQSTSTLWVNLYGLQLTRDQRQTLKYAKQVFRLQQRIERDLVAESRLDMISAVVILSGGVSLLVGGLMTVPMLITAGYIALLAGASLFLFNKGIHWGDESKKESFKEEVIRSAGMALSGLEACFDYNVHPIGSENVEGQVVPPFYPQFPYNPHGQYVLGDDCSTDGEFEEEGVSPLLNRHTGGPFSPENSQYDNASCQEEQKTVL